MSICRPIGVSICMTVRIAVLVSIRDDAARCRGVIRFRSGASDFHILVRLRRRLVWHVGICDYRLALRLSPSRRLDKAGSFRLAACASATSQVMRRCCSPYLGSVVTHTGVLPVCDRVTRIDMVIVCAVVATRCQGFWLETGCCKTKNWLQAREEGAQSGREPPKSLSRHFATAADHQWHVVWRRMLCLLTWYKFWLLGTKLRQPIGACCMEVANFIPSCLSSFAMNTTVIDGKAILRW